MRKGLYFIISFLLTWNSYAIADEMPFYKYKYLRIGNGICAKCSFTLKQMANVEDKYKPFIVITNEENKYINDILEFNGLLKYPKDKILINSSLAEKLPIKDFAVLYYSNNNDSFNSMLLDQKAQLYYIKWILGSHSVSKQIFDSAFFLPPFTEYYFENNSILFCNDYSKTITFFNSRKDKIIVKLTNSFKRKVFQKLSKDSSTFNQLLDGGMKATQYGVDNSFFGSVFNQNDTLFILAYISIVKKIKTKFKSSQIQVLVKVYNSNIVSSHYIKYNPKKHIIFDEAGEHSMLFINDSLYLIASRYNLFEKLKKRNHLTLFILRDNDYYPVKNYNLEIPNDLLKGSNDTLDVTSGHFFNFNSLNYFYINSPNIYFSGENLRFKSALFANPQKYSYNSKNMCFYEQNGIFTTLISKNDTFDTYLRIGTIDDEVILPIQLEGFNYNAKITENKITYISSDGFYIQKSITPAQ